MSSAQRVRFAGANFVCQVDLLFSFPLSYFFRGLHTGHFSFDSESLVLSLLVKFSKFDGFAYESGNLFDFKFCRRLVHFRVFMQIYLQLLSNFVLDLYFTKVTA